MPNLATTNVLLGIMAGVSVLEGLVIIGIGVGSWMAYRRFMNLLTGLEQRHIAVAMGRVNAILDDVKAVSATVKTEAERVDHAIHRTIDQVDDTAHRVKENVRAKTRPVVAVMLGLRTAFRHFARSYQKATAD